MFKTVENFYKFILVYLSQTADMLGIKVSNVLVNDSFAASFIYLELKQECKDYMKLGKTRSGKLYD